MTSELRQPDMSKPFIIYTDASNEAVGAVFNQMDQNVQEYVVTYASKTFRNYEKHMSISEKEIAAFILEKKSLDHLY